MDKGIEELNNALSRLSGRIEGGGDTWPSPLAIAASACDELADVFRDVNNSIFAGWGQCRDLFYSLNGVTYGTIERVYELIKEYVYKTRENEDTHQESLENYNNKAEEILKDIGI